MSARFTQQLQMTLIAWLTTLACALAFGPLIAGLSYVVVAVLLTAVPVLVGIGLRAARVPAIVVVAGQVVALFMWVTAVYADGAAFGLLPTPTAVESIRLLVDAGLETARLEPPPAPADSGLVLLTALGIAGCHLLVDTFATTLHRVPLTGLPLLALYTVPAAISPDGVPTLAFVLAAAGFVAMLATDERWRIGHWGRRLAHAGVTSQRQSRIIASTVNAAAQRVGVLAIAVAAVVPLMLPEFPDGLFGRGPGDGPGEGGTVSVSNPIVDIRRELRELSDEEALRVRTSGAPPEYFRLAALDKFDGRRWQFSPRRLNTQFQVNQQMAHPPGLDAEIPATTRTFEVEVSDDFRSDWLPAPYAAQRVVADGDWRYNPETMDIISSDDDLTTAGMSYRLTSLIPDPSGDRLASSAGIPADITTTYTELPDDLPEKVGDLSDKITGTATRYEKAVALQRWFRAPGNFEYTLDPPAGHSGSDLVDFLEDRRGYCEQFAAAMAVMARHEGIPARVAVGFLRGQRLGPQEYRFTYADMHAWPELYFEGAGWIRFEPTPGSRDGAVAPNYSTGDSSGDSTDPEENEPTTEPTTQPQDPDRQLDPGAATGTGDSNSSGGAGLLLVAAGALGLVLLPGLLRVVVRRRRWARAGDPSELAEAAWSELRDTVIDLRHTWPGSTPRRTAALLQASIAHSEAASAALGRIALAVEQARYARTSGPWQGLQDDVRQVEDTLRAMKGRTDQFRARLLPRSLRAGYRRWAENRPLRSQTRDDDASALPSSS